MNRDKVLKVYVDEGEYGRLKKSADDIGISISQYVRRSAMRMVWKNLNSYTTSVGPWTIPSKPLQRRIQMLKGER